jgi:uncharacterized membrane protein YjfL (UPF0719 family)
MNLAADLLPLLNQIGWSLPLFLVAFAALWFAKALYQKTSSFDFADQLTEKDNPAFGTALSGYLFGATIALTAAFPKEPALSWDALMTALGWLAVQGLLVAALMRMSLWIISHFVILKLGVSREMVRDRNVGAGAVVAGGCIAAGLVLHGALSGNSDSPLLALRDLLVFWTAGQLILVGGAWLYDHAARYDVQRALSRDNIAAGFSLGGFLAAVGIMIDAALAGASSNLASELLITVTISAIGLLLLLCTAIVAARVFLPHSPIPKEISIDQNPAVGLLSAACFVAVALLLAHVIAP